MHPRSIIDDDSKTVVVGLRWAPLAAVPTGHDGPSISSDQVRSHRAHCNNSLHGLVDHTQTNSNKAQWFKQWFKPRKTRRYCTPKETKQIYITESF